MPPTGCRPFHPPRFRGSERIADPAVGRRPHEQLSDLRQPLLLPSRLVAQVLHAALRTLGLLKIRPRRDVFGLGMSGEVDLVQRLVVDEEDDLGPEQRLRPRREPIIDLLEEPLLVSLPALVDDRRTKVQMYLASGSHEIVDGPDPSGNRGGPHVHYLCKLFRHQGEADPGIALWIVLQEVAVHVAQGFER